MANGKQDAMFDILECEEEDGSEKFSLRNAADVHCNNYQQFLPKKIWFSHNNRVSQLKLEPFYISGCRWSDPYMQEWDDVQ